MRPEEILKRAEHARQLLEDPMLKEALDLIEKEVILEWGGCPARDKDGREELWKFYKTALKFRGILQGAIESGKVAQFQEKSLKEQVLSFVRKT